MTEPQHSLQAVGRFACRFNQLAQADGTKDLVLMLRDALPAEKPPALRTAPGGLAPFVVVTTFVGDIRHGSFKIALEFQKNMFVKIAIKPVLAQPQRLKYNSIAEATPADHQYSIFILQFSII